MLIKESYVEDTIKCFKKECNEIRLKIPAYGEEYLGRYLFPNAVLDTDKMAFNYNEFEFVFHDYYEFIDFCDKMNELKRELQKEISKQDKNRIEIRKGW